MGQVNGLVLKRISKKSGTSARGTWTAYSLCVGPPENDDNDNWYRQGFDAPKAAEGSVVSFEYEEKDGNRTVKGAINVDKAKTADVAKAAPVGAPADVAYSSAFMLPVGVKTFFR